MAGRSTQATSTNLTGEDLLGRYARLMRERYGAELYLFGSRARGTSHAESDYDLVAVSDAFAGKRRTVRAPDRYRLWREAGGFGTSLDLHCYTPQEFQRELGGLGYLGQANERGELVRIPVSSAA